MKDLTTVLAMVKKECQLTNPMVHAQSFQENMDTLLEDADSMRDGTMSPWAYVPKLTMMAAILVGMIQCFPDNFGIADCGKRSAFETHAAMDEIQIMMEEGK